MTCLKDAMLSRLMPRVWVLVVPWSVVATSPRTTTTTTTDYAYDNFWGIDRYVRFDQEPQAIDKDRAIVFGGDVKCDVCTNIIVDLTEGPRTNWHPDSLLEALEADSIDSEAIEKAPTDMHKHVAKHKKGCNKLYKDNFFLRGWDLLVDFRPPEGFTGNPDTLEHWKKAARYHAEHTGKIPNSTEIDTYTVKMEAAYFACEATIGMYRDELVEHIAPRLEKRGDESLRDIISEACRAMAKCSKRSKSESLAARALEAEKAYKGRQEEVLHTVVRDERKKKREAKAAKKKAEKAEKAKRRRKGAKEDEVEL
eukprot:CAMPEP_0204576740 /NCGR_PEP_ID=MMETSP0661-20131031/41940_1 /ASSEMBLY_ACC=CAM_ASM_000606 /TAXON_ID=109239 /ORGANISM="Alexandrium margalefi, Strain AMGDE01CS-322" /LENGTH=309 /DNA_ID=CAMNT_0051585513 /DNA_START=44 /DNA_END=973 /DNA_ORIENTATION=-